MRLLRVTFFVFCVGIMSSCSSVLHLREFPYVGPRINIGMHRSKVEKILGGGPNQVSYSYDNYEINTFMGVNTKRIVSRGFGGDYRIILHGGVKGRAFFRDGVTSFIDKKGKMYGGSGPDGNRNYIITIYYDQKYKVRDIRFKEVYQPNFNGEFLSY